jgi:hypothetical protein
LPLEAVLDLGLESALAGLAVGDDSAPLEPESLLFLALAARFEGPE